MSIRGFEETAKKIMMGAARNETYLTAYLKARLVSPFLPYMAVNAGKSALPSDPDTIVINAPKLFADLEPSYDRVVGYC